MSVSVRFLYSDITQFVNGLVCNCLKLNFFWRFSFVGSVGYFFILGVLTAKLLPSLIDCLYVVDNVPL